MDHQISARRPNLEVINKQKKRICRIVNFVFSADHRVKVRGSEKRDKCQDLARELKKNMEHESDININCN